MADGDKSDGTTSMILGAIALGLVVWGLWYVSKPYLIDFTHFYRSAQVDFFKRTVPNHTMTMEMPDGAGRMRTYVVDWDYFDRQLARSDMSEQARLMVLDMSAHMITPLTKWPALIFLGIIVTWAIVRAPGTRFRTRHTLESLIGAQAKAWPVIAPIVRFNPSEADTRKPGSPVPQDLPPFAEALSPIEFVAKHGLGDPAQGLDEEAMKTAFAAQLGPRWDGAAALPLHKRALFAAFALKGARKREEADELLGEIAPYWSPKTGLELPRPLLKRIDAIIADPEIGGVADDIAWEHAYTTPALVRLLLWARQQGGVLAPSYFLWLRDVDRALWYPLNNAGRQAFHPEAAGAMAHHMAEVAAGRPLIQPKVNAAIVALTGYLEENPQAVPPLLGAATDAPAPKKAASRARTRPR